MHLDKFTVLLAASNLLLGAAAGPVFAKRQDQSTPTPSATSESSAEVTSSTRVRPSVGLIVETMSNGEETTIEVIAPNPTPDASATGDSSAETTEDPSKTTYTFSRTGLPIPASTKFPVCKDAKAKPFCQPNDESTLHVGKTYYATWNSDFFPANSTVVVKVLYANDTTEEVWSSDETPNGWGYVAFDTKKSWKQGYDRFNLSLQALSLANSDDAKAEAFDGPKFTLIDEPPRHYPPPPPTKFHKEGLYIGLPLALCFVVLVVVGLAVGMRKHRTIGLGNVMGRSNRGYGQRKSRRERLGLGKKGAIRLEDRETTAHSRDRSNSLGSLTGDDDARPIPHSNQFQDEIRRQKTGRHQY